MARVALRFRIDFANGFSVGPGKIDLLRAIDKHGSLSEAAKSIGLTYRRAWLLVEDFNDTFRQPVTTFTVGSRTGGSVCVSSLSKTVSSAYEEADRYHRDYASTHLKALSGLLSAESRPAASKPPIGDIKPARRARPRLRTE